MKKLICLVLFLLLLSCDKLKPTKGFDENNLMKPEDLGEFHKLSNDNISIYLPEGFSELTEDQIKAFHQQIEDENIRFYFEKSYEAQQFIKGNFYDFYSEDNASEVGVHTLPYMPFGRGDAGQLLYFLRKSFKEYQKVTGIYHNKIRAAYSGDKSMQVFKARYRLSRYNSYDNENDAQNFEMFKIVYLITSRKKTFMITLLSPFEIDFDPYIRKIKL